MQRPPGGSSKWSRLCEKIEFANGARFVLPKMVEGPPGCPSGPSITCSSSTLAGDFGPLHRGPISRPYPTREPLLIGAPRAGSAEPTDGQAIAASSTTIRNCIQCRQETITLYPRYSTFAQHLPRPSRDTLSSRSRCGSAVVGPSVNVIYKLIEREP